MQSILEGSPELPTHSTILYRQTTTTCITNKLKNIAMKNAKNNLIKDYNVYCDQISKTGFVLENKIANLLKNKKWTVISNKYYVDDTEESVREIDLVAYKVSKIQQFDVYTALIISCKKNELNDWALLARSIDLKDPNSNWYPLHAWSNDKAISYQLSLAGKDKHYHDSMRENKVRNVLDIPTVEVFAFQEMKKGSGAPQNDKNIFQSITSLMKAQAYELGGLSQRKSNPAIYQFNLLSIVDTELIRIMLTDDEISASSIDSEHYIARYIIKKQEEFSRIRFITANSFADEIANYNKLHIENCKWFKQEYNIFYENAILDNNKIKLFLENFKNEIKYSIRTALYRNYLKVPDELNIGLCFNKESNILRIWAAIPEQGLEKINNDKRLIESTANILNKIYKYNGPFEFEGDDIPF